MGHVLHDLVDVAEGLDVHDLQELGDLLDGGLLGGGRPPSPPRTCPGVVPSKASSEVCFRGAGDAREVPMEMGLGEGWEPPGRPLRWG